MLLVEAKAHIAEIVLAGQRSGGGRRARIETALDRTAAALGAAARRAAWIDTFYQLANRLAHLHVLCKRGVRAWLVLVNFIGDDEMGGPAHRETWEADYAVALHALGLPKRHPLAPYVIKVCPDVAELARTSSRA